MLQVRLFFINLNVIFLLIFYLVVLDGNHKNHRARCVSSYQTASNNDNDMCCKETPLQGSYFCLKHNLLTTLDHIPNYDGIFFTLKNKLFLW